MNHKQTTSDGLATLYQRYYKNNPQRQLELEKARLDDRVAREIVKLKEINNLSTKDLAKLLDLEESTIESLENAEYEGDSFLMLNIIARGLKMKVQFELIVA